MKERDDKSGKAGHADSPRQDHDEPQEHHARPTPAHDDGPLPTTGRQPQRPGQDGRYEPRPGARDPETLKPSDE